MLHAEAHREILGLHLVTTEDVSGCTAFFRGLVALVLSGVQLLVSVAHGALIDAIASVLPLAAWLLCLVHFVRYVLSRVPKATPSLVASLIRSIFYQPDA